MNTKILITLFSLSLLFSVTYGQVTEVEKKLRKQSADTIQGWKTGGVFALNASQTSLTNWGAGGEKSVSANGIFSVFANYKRNKTVWDNSLNMGYGFLLQGEDNEYRKTDDKIDLLSKYGQEAFKNFYYAALFNFKTQMDAGYNYPNDTSKVKISDLFAPAYILVALGMDYKPNSYFSAFVAPVTAKFTIVNSKLLSDQGAFGVTHGDKLKSEVGGYIRVIYSKNDFEKEILKNVSFTTKIDLFSNYKENPQNIDVSWETMIAMKVNKYIAVNINTHLLYDDNVISKIQFKEILGVGFSYKF